MKKRITKNVYRIIGKNKEIIDTFDTYKEARENIKEYRIAFQGSMGALEIKFGREKIN